MDIGFNFSDELGPALARASRAGADFSPAMAAISSLLAGAVEERFEQERAPDGTPWKPSRRALEHGGKTLQERGMKGGLLGSLLGSAGYDARSSWIGTNLIYAAIHQTGGKKNDPVHQSLLKKEGPSPNELER